MSPEPLLSEPEELSPLELSALFFEESEPLALPEESELLVSDFPASDFPASDFPEVEPVCSDLSPPEDDPSDLSDLPPEKL